MSIAFLFRRTLGRFRDAVRAFKGHPVVLPRERVWSPATIGIDIDIDRGACIDLNIPAAIEFRPRGFIFNGTPNALLIRRVFVANGSNANFGEGYLADVYDGRMHFVAPTFYNSPPLTITVQNISGRAATFAGVLTGEETHD